MRRSRQPWSCMGLPRRFVEHRREAIGCTGLLSNAPNLIRFEYVIRVRTLVNFSTILVDHLFQKPSNEGTLLWTTGSHEIMIFAIADEVKKQLIKIPFLGLCHSIEREPNQCW